jgi:hypothetical protein
MGCVRRHGEPLVGDPGRITTSRALGIDEHLLHQLAGRAATITCSGLDAPHVVATGAAAVLRTAS